MTAFTALPTLASPPANPRVGDTYVESTHVRNRTRTTNRVNPATGALERVQQTFQDYRDQTKVYQQVGSHPEVRPTTRPEWQQIGTQRVPFTNRRWVEPPPPTRVYAYGRTDNSTQWQRWNEGYQTTQNLMGNRYSVGQDMSVGAKWTIYSLVMRGGNDRVLVPGYVYLYTEDGTIVGQ